MALHFTETMAGLVITAQGPRHFEFTVTASSDSLLALIGWQPLNLRGQATLEGVVADACVLAESQLEIGLPLHRFLRYQVHFRDAAGTLYRFFGEKTVHLTCFPRTMTTLTGALFRDGTRLGPATLRFAFEDVPRFLSSFRLAA